MPFTCDFERQKNLLVESPHGLMVAEWNRVYKGKICPVILWGQLKKSKLKNSLIEAVKAKWPLKEAEGPPVCNVVFSHAIETELGKSHIFIDKAKGE